MIMVLSCCDLLTVLTHHPVTALLAISCFTEKINRDSGWWSLIDQLSNISLIFSLLALFVANFDRYLSTYHPILHRTSVTKRKRLTLFIFLIIFEIILAVPSINNLVINQVMVLLIFGIMLVLSMLFFNYKLFTIARTSRRRDKVSPQMKKSFCLKKISSCLLAVACLLFYLLQVWSIFYYA